MEDTARRLVAVTQDPKGYPAGTQPEPPQIPVTAYTVVLEADYEKIFKELERIKDAPPQPVGDGIKGRWTMNVCPTCGKAELVTSMLTTLGHCTGNMLNPHPATRRQRIRVVPE
jgi:hypothetical protein